MVFVTSTTMQSWSLQLCNKTLNSSTHRIPNLGFHHTLSSVTSQNLLKSLSLGSDFSKSVKYGRFSTKNQNSNKNYDSGSNKGKVKVKLKGNKENVWSVDNEVEKSSSSAKGKGRGKDTRRNRRGGKRMVNGIKGGNSRVLVSGAMLMEVETVLQTQEPVIRPAWTTFASSVSGIWKGVGAVFSPITAEIEPIDIGKKNENLYDCYMLSRIEAVPSPSGRHATQIKRKINWVTLNPHGEIVQHNGNQINEGAIGNASSLPLDRRVAGRALPKFESFNLETSDVMEEDVMDNEPGLVFFEDGSYSRGPINIPVGEVSETEYYLNPTLKFEQCLVKGCHKRLRIVHTIEFSNGGSEIQIMRVAVYEEQWVSTADLDDHSDINCDLEPFSQRKRTRPSDLAGQWKVFEVEATPIFGADTEAWESTETPYVYLCTETLKKRNSPEYTSSFRDEEIVDMQDVTVLWLPGGVTAYVDVKKDGVLCIGVGWYSDEGINLVMERDYGVDGILKEVRSKTEVKRRWSDPLDV